MKITDTLSIVRWQQVYTPNAAMIRFTLEREGCRVFQWNGFFNTAVPQHKSDKVKIYQVIAGKMEVCTERFGTFELEAGDQITVPAGNYHSVHFLCKEEENVIYVVGER